MPVTIYGDRDAMSAFFVFPTENAREILPDHLEPVEVHHGTSIIGKMRWPDCSCISAMASL